MALVKYVAIILFIVICLAKLVSVMRLSKKERGRLLGILCLTCIIFALIFILLYR